MLQKKKVTLGLLLMLLIGAFLVRFIHIDTVPAGITPKEAIIGLEALSQKNESPDFFYETHQERTPLFIGLQKYALSFFGNTPLALRFWSILFGTLTVLGVFLLAKELIGSDRAGLIGAYLTAFSYSTIHFSRIGSASIMLPFILSVTFYFIFRAIRTKKYLDSIFGGILCGVGSYMHAPLRLFLFLLVTTLTVFALSKRHFFKAYWKHLLVFAVTALIIAAPMFIDFFVIDTGQRQPMPLALPTENTGLSKETTFGQKFSIALGQYFFRGDQDWQRNYPPYPILNPAVSIAFGIGLLYLIFASLKMLRSRFKRDTYFVQPAARIFLLLWFLIFLATEALSEESGLDPMYPLGILPVVMLIATVPFEWILSHACTYGRGFIVIIFSFTAASLLFIGVFDVTKYHHFFAKNPWQQRSFAANLTKEASYIKALPHESEKFVIVTDRERLPVEFLTHKIPGISFYNPTETDQIQPKDPNTMHIFMNRYDADVAARLLLRFPALQIRTIQDVSGNTFYTITN